MDWGRAKSILIVVFIILNIFLLTNISLSEFSKGNPKGAIQSTLSIMENKGVILECEIPNFNGTMGRLEIYNESSFDMPRIATKLMENKHEIPKEIKPGWEFSDGGRKFRVEDNYTFTYINNSPNQKWDISKKRLVEKSVRKFLEDNEINITGLVVDFYEETLEGNIKIGFIQKYEGLNVFSNTINAVVSDNGVKELECSARRLGKLDRESSRVVPAYKILLTYFSNFHGTVITGIDIGYTMDREDNDLESSNQKPVWRISIKGSKPRWFDALTGMEK